MKCNECKYWKASKSTLRLGTCHLNPPVAGGAFPEVLDDDFCAKFTRRHADSVKSTRIDVEAERKAIHSKTCKTCRYWDRGDPQAAMATHFHSTSTGFPVVHGKCTRKAEDFDLGAVYSGMVKPETFGCYMWKGRPNCPTTTPRTLSIGTTPENKLTTVIGASATRQKPGCYGAADPGPLAPEDDEPDEPNGAPRRVTY